MKKNTMLQELVSAVKSISLMVFKFHFVAVVRVLLAAAGFRRSYLIHCNVMVPGGRVAALSFVYTCKPWFTVYHLPEVESIAAKSAGMQSPNTRVTIISVSSVGNP